MLHDCVEIYSRQHAQMLTLLECNNSKHADTWQLEKFKARCIHGAATMAAIQQQDLGCGYAGSLQMMIVVTCSC